MRADDEPPSHVFLKPKQRPRRVPGPFFDYRSGLYEVEKEPLVTDHREVTWPAG